MTTVLEGVTLGSLEYEPVGSATGYVAFTALTLYLIGVVMIGTGSLAPRSTVLAIRNPTEPEQLH
jgi:hypothetical protein